MDLVSISASIPETLTVPEWPLSELPVNWRSYPAPEALADVGARWAQGVEVSGARGALAVIPQELNYLLNPRALRLQAHPGGQAGALSLRPTRATPLSERGVECIGIGSAR